MLRVVDSELQEKVGEIPATLDELAHEGARRMLLAALEEEVVACLAAHGEARVDRDRAQGIRNGRARARKMTVGEAIEAFDRAYRDRHPKAVECLRKDGERLLTFFDFPREHWTHLRTTNVIESASRPCGCARRSPRGRAAAR